MPARVSNGMQNCLSLILVGRRNFDTTAEQCVGNERGKHEKEFQPMLQLHLSSYGGFLSVRMHFQDGWLVLLEEVMRIHYLVPRVLVCYLHIIGVFLVHPGSLP